MFERRWIWVAVAAGVLLCGWCSVLSGVAGWAIGGDIASRESRARFQATATAQSNLPPLGVLVTRLDRSGPAMRAGVRRGDVITALNGASVADARDLRDALDRLRVGDHVRLTLDDGTRSREVQLDLAAFPDSPQRAYLGIYFTARAEDPADL